VERVVPLTYGWGLLPETVSIHGGDPRRRLREPVPGILLLVDSAWVLLDTGFNDPLVRDLALKQRFHGGEVEPVLPHTEQDCLEWAFERVGVPPADVSRVAVSHLHNDHAGGLRHFAGRLPVHCQARELDYARRDPVGAEANGIFSVDFDDPRMQWVLADGEAEIAPGIRAVPSYGHTPGHQSFVVELSPAARDRYGVGGFVFAFDAADLQFNIDQEHAVGGLIDAQPEESVEVIRRLKSLATARGYRLVPGHDPEVWPELTEQLLASGG
jgi:N-acyl homoserine lactone hydrolase